MKLKQISVFLENAPGRLYETVKALADEGVNLRALSHTASRSDLGVLRLLVSDVTSARRILMEKNFPARVDDVLAVEIEDKPGSLATMCKPLRDADIRILHMYAFTAFSSERAVMVLGLSDVDQAIDVLRQKGHKILEASAFGMA